VRDDGGSDIVQRGLESLSDRASGRLHPGSSSPRWSSLPSRPHFESLTGGLEESGEGVDGG